MVHDQTGQPVEVTAVHEIDSYSPGAFRLGKRRWDVVGGDETDDQVSLHVVVAHPSSSTLVAYVTITVPITVVDNVVTVGEATVRRA